MAIFMALSSEACQSSGALTVSLCESINYFHVRKLMADYSSSPKDTLEYQLNVTIYAIVYIITRGG